MLEQIDLNKKMTKREYAESIDVLEVKLGELQRKCREYQIPVMIVFEGFSASGKGILINKLIRPLDPRGFDVFTTKESTDEEQMYPFLWRFNTWIPAKGRIHIFDQSWYQRFIDDMYHKEKKNGETLIDYDEIINFEKQYHDDGMILLKFFLHIKKEEQKKRIDKMQENPETSWRVTKKDTKQNKQYEKYLKIFDEMLVRTDTPYAPWTIVESMNTEYAACKVLTSVVKRLEMAIEQLEKKADNIIKGIKPDEKAEEEEEQRFRNGTLNQIDLSLTMEQDEYKQKKKDLQNRLSALHNLMYQKRVPVILAFEGWDAAGKGGAIKRLTECMDPRGYRVIPISAPNDMEKSHHYLWRFWNHVPKAGHMAIFDRTWYGRVLVERVEGFASKEEWKRAYNEINHMEEQFTNSGCIVLKFWLHIDKEEQERRFLQRQENPDKRWKITEEDWRNRSKWDLYEEAVDEMIVRTSTSHAPWIIVEANSKLYARIKILETVVETLEKRML